MVFIDLGPLKSENKRVSKHQLLIKVTSEPKLVMTTDPRYH